MTILRRLLGLKRKTSAEEKKKTKVYRNPITGKTRTVTKGVDKWGRKYKDTSVRKKSGKEVKSKSVMKGEKGMLASGKKILLGRYKTKSKDTKRARKFTEKGTQFKYKKLSKENKGQKFLSGRTRGKRL